ncbi:MAG: OmpA family protein [Pseudomonadota bacterium]
MKRLLLPVILCVFLSASASGGAESPILSPVPARISDRVISADIDTINGLQKRLTDINSGGTPIGSYHFAKAQAWVDMAMDEYVMNDRTRVVEDALIQADQIIVQLEAKKSDIGMDTLLLPTSTMLRPDLWRLAAELKKNSGFSCGEDLVARLEVQLVWAGHEENQLGWRNAKPYIQAAERLAGDARKKIENCSASQMAVISSSSAVNDAGQVSPVPVSSDSTRCPKNEGSASSGVIETVPDRVHFAVNSDLLGSRSAAVLERLAMVLKGDPDLNVELQGHADERGSDTFNLTLSLNRAEVVKTYLVAAGIPAGCITVKAFGRSQPVSSGNDIGSYARNRRVEFFFSGNSKQLQVIAQNADLRIEEIPVSGR